MSRQGKMHSSPFHVESSQYKYAIEHENEGYSVCSERVECDSLNGKTKYCKLWNIGCISCISWKCAYYNASLRRNASCNECAFYYSKKCFHPKRPLNCKMNIKDGQYCCFYYEIGKNKNRYFFIKNCCERIMLTKLVKDCKNKIESKNLYIRQAEEELHSQKISSDTKAYLSDKICAKADERARAEILLEKYLSRLSSIGGSLNSFPNSSSSQQKRHKKQLKRKK